MSIATKNIFIIGAKRTPFGAFGGKLKNLTSTDLAVHTSIEAIRHYRLLLLLLVLLLF